VTIDEELNKLEDDIRRLKVEYEVYFNGASPRPPHDTVHRVETVIKRYSSDQSKLSFSQRYRFTNLTQKYVVNSQLWRRKLQEKEEGRSSCGVSRREPQELPADGSMTVICSDPERESEKVDQLLQAMLNARRMVGGQTDNIDPYAFQKLIREKTKQIKQSLGCQRVQFSVSVEDGKVKFKATKAD
jgi:hypothetical protein